MNAAAEHTAPTSGWKVSPSIFFSEPAALSAPSQKGTLAVEVLSASHLISSDFLDKSDPYVEIRLQNRAAPAPIAHWETRTVPDSVFPVWMEQHTFKVDATA